MIKFLVFVFLTINSLFAYERSSINTLYHFEVSDLTFQVNCSKIEKKLFTSYEEKVFQLYPADAKKICKEASGHINVSFSDLKYALEQMKDIKTEHLLKNIEKFKTLEFSEFWIRKGIKKLNFELIGYEFNTWNMEHFKHSLFLPVVDFKEIKIGTINYLNRIVALPNKEKDKHFYLVNYHRTTDFIDYFDKKYNSNTKEIEGMIVFDKEPPFLNFDFTNSYNIGKDKECIDGTKWMKKYGKNIGTCPYILTNKSYKTYMKFLEN